MHVAIVSKQDEDSLPSFQGAEVSILEEKGTTATRQGINYLLKHYRKMSMDFLGPPLTANYMRSEVLCC